MNDDRAPIDMVTVPFETVVDVFLDGVGTGAASALAKIRPDAPHAMVDEASQALRKRLRGETDNRTTEIRTWGDSL